MFVELEGLFLSFLKKRKKMVAAVDQEIESQNMTQEMVVAAATEFENRRRCEHEADEQALLEQLLQGNGMEEK